MAPWNYRPEHRAGFDPAEDEEWEDNGISNALAYASQTVTPNWCASAEHWTVRLVLYLWADCSCCLFYRGVTLGLALGLAAGVGLAALF